MCSNAKKKKMLIIFNGINYAKFKFGNKHIFVFDRVSIEL